MEFYKTVKNIVLGTFVASLPYLCDNGCSYFDKKAEAAIARTQKQKIIEKQNLETLAILPKKIDL